MLPHEIQEFSSYPNVHAFLEHHVSMQFGDVREMLRLPLPALQMTHACNFAAAGTLCGFISGISVSIYQPSKTTAMEKIKGIKQKAPIQQKQTERTENQNPLRCICRPILRRMS